MSVHEHAKIFIEKHKEKDAAYGALITNPQQTINYQQVAPLFNPSASYDGGFSFILDEIPIEVSSNQLDVKVFIL